MRAVGYRSPGEADVLEDIELPDPTPSGRDLLVEVQAISVNPVDTKVRRRQGPAEGSEHHVLGYDAAGVVRAVGEEVTAYSPGDEVWYAGAVTRPGADSELHLVDEQIVSRRPRSLDVAQAAAMPLTAITAWELLHDRLGVEPGGGEGRTLLVVGAAGGVGSVLVQLAATQTRLRVVGTASRPETQEWVRSLGAHDVVDHGRPLAEEVRGLGLDGVELVAALTHTDQHWDQLVEVLAPQGRIGVIDDPAGGLDVMPLKAKSASLAWELMFTRSTFQTPDVAEQGRILGEVARLVDEGVLRTTTSVSDPETITAAHLREAHAFVESGRAVGKVVLAGWPG